MIPIEKEKKKKKKKKISEIFFFISYGNVNYSIEGARKQRYNK